MAKLNFDDIKTRAESVRSAYGERDSQLEQIETMYTLEWGDAPRELKATVSPDARNAVLGATRLLTATDPKFKITLEDGGDKFEEVCRQMWQTSGRMNRSPVHYDLVLSALLYGEMHLQMTSVDDLIAAKGQTPAQKSRLEAIRKRTPFIFTALSPKTGYPEWDSFGLSGYFNRTERTVQSVISSYPEAEGELAGKKSTELVYLCDWTDLENRAVWVEGGQPFLLAPHGLPFLPVVCSVGEGSTLFVEPEKRAVPFLYTLYKSELWKRQNLALTVLYSMISYIGAYPVFLFKSPTRTENELDFSKPGSVISLQQGESIEPLAKNAIDPSIREGLQLAQELGTESTIYKQAMGQPPSSGGMAFSTVSLLSQSGRLPLIPTQRNCGWLISTAMEQAFIWAKQMNIKLEMGQGREAVKIQKAEIPDDITVVATLDVDLPQDKLQQANIAAMLTKGDNPLASTEWARTNFLGIDNNSKEQERIWAEQYANLMAQKLFFEQQALLKAQMQQYMQPQQPPMAGNPGMPPGGGGIPTAGGQRPPQIPPELMQQMMQSGSGKMPPVMAMNEAQGQGFNPAQGGLPPGMAGQLPDGMMPPDQQGGMPV